jgi:hypothetical protein
MRKFRKTHHMRKSRKNLKNKISHRMRGGGGSQSREPKPEPTPPPLYGIVVGLDGRHYVESFYLQPGSAGIQFYASSQDPPVMLQVTKIMGVGKENETKTQEFLRSFQTTATATPPPRPVALIEHLLSGMEGENFNPTVLSGNRYLYSCRSDADEALRQLMDSAAVLATGHPSEAVSNRAKAFLQQKLFTPSQRKGAVARGGLDASLIESLTQGLPPPQRTIQMAKTSMLRPPKSEKYGSEGGRSARRRRRII